MRKLLPLLAALLLAGNLSAQEADTTYWTRTALGTFTFTQVNLNNWAGGGNNSVSLNSNLVFNANYRKERTTWQNSLDLAYGLVDQGGVGFQKSDDKINFVTKFGYNLKPEKGKLYWSSLLDFRTQFANGFASPEDPERISTFMAPGYLVLSTGLEYSPNDHFSVSFGPLTGKVTFVLDDSLASVGAFGVEPGERTRAELGGFLRGSFNQEIVENVVFISKAEFFANYVTNVGNIDVNWENQLKMKVNSWLAVNLIAHFIYDDDINIEILDDDGNPTGRSGPRLQFKQLFGVGISYQVSNRK